MLCAENKTIMMSVCMMSVMVQAQQIKSAS